MPAEVGRSLYHLYGKAPCDRLSRQGEDKVLFLGFQVYGVTGSKGSVSMATGSGVHADGSI